MHLDRSNSHGHHAARPDKIVTAAEAVRRILQLAGQAGQDGAGR